MRAVNIKEAKAHLNELIDAATAGEQVVLMRGSKHVAAIVPLSADQLEIAPELSDAQADSFWARVRSEQKGGKTKKFSSLESAVKFMTKPTRKRVR